MRDLLGSGTIIGYGTNVHAGADFDLALTNLERFVPAVKRIVSPDQPMGVGLWFSADAARQMRREQRIAEFAGWLDQQDLIAFTLNGFPYGDFHRSVVKQKVYQPRWDQPQRLIYAIDLAHILAQLMGERSEGGVSTLPIAWRADVREQVGCIEQSAAHLLQAARHLHQLEQETGKYVHLDLEPEPGCFLDTAYDVVRFFKEHLFRDGEEALVRRHVRVCHDVCHAAVMFEDQADVWAQYAAAGVSVGKVQLSSAIRLRFDRLNIDHRKTALKQLARFAEIRYLHQTMVAQPDRLTPTFFTDLPEALDKVADLPVDHPAYPTELRTHFHVPLFLETFGLLETTQDELLNCLSLMHNQTDCRLFEVETYAWNVLPKELQVDDLAEGVAHELNWLRDRILAETAP